jgi:DNA repair protein RadC
MENAMDMSTLSRAELEGALLSSPHDGTDNRVCDPIADHDARGSHTNLVSHRLQVARELLLRDLRDRMCSGPIMGSPQAVRDWLRLYCADLQQEVFILLYLTAHHALIEAVQQFSGTLTQTAVYPREVVRGALQRNAAAVILAHNHPSGQAEPSRADEHVTQTLKSALTLVDVRVLDHLVVAGDQVVSMAERGLV